MYVPSLILIPFQDMARPGINYEKNVYGEITLSIYKIGFLSLSSIYKPSFISISLVLFKIWPGQASIMKNGLGEITQ